MGKGGGSGPRLPARARARVLLLQRVKIVLVDAVETRGVVYAEPGAPVAVEDILVGPPAAGEVLVRVEASGICHSDVHVVETGGWGMRFPILLGHEGAGVVEAVGDGVSSVSPGQRVVIAWRAPCGQCDACRRGDARRCSSAFSRHSRPRRAKDGATLSPLLRTGTFAPWCVVHESCAVPVDLPAEEACLLACGVMTGVGAALWATPVRPGSSVAVIGCGGVGLSVIQGARIAGAARIAAIDVDEGKLERARSLGATETASAQDAPALEPFDYAFSAVGSPAALAQAVKLLRFAGTATLVGIPPGGAGLDVDLEQDVFHRKATIAVTHGGDSIPKRYYPELARLAHAGELDLASLVSKEIALDDVPEELGRPPAGIRTVVRL